VPQSTRKDRYNLNSVSATSLLVDFKCFSSAFNTSAMLALSFFISAGSLSVRRRFFMSLSSSPATKQAKILSERREILGILPGLKKIFLPEEDLKSISVNVSPN